VLIALCTASCAAPLMKLPQGPGTPISEAEALATLTEATAVCNGVKTLTAEIAVSGSAAGHRMRGRLLAGVATSAESARLEAVAPFGQPLFIFASSGGRATLLLPRDGRVLQDAPAGDVLDAVAGIPLNSADLLTTLIGCPQAYSFATGVAFGADWRVVRASGAGGWKTLYLHRSGGGQAWQLAAVQRDNVNWRAEYGERQNGLPRSIHLATTTPSSNSAPGFNLTLVLSQVETNVPLGADVFHIDVPRAADPITLEELRRARPGVREN
jgi:hypothetical protein